MIMLGIIFKKIWMDPERLSLSKIILFKVLAFLNISTTRYFPNMMYSFGISELFACLNMSNIRYFLHFLCDEKCL